MKSKRRAVILPVILLVLALLGLLGAMFSLRVNADLASMQVVAERLQTRLAAEAGIQRVKLLLAEARFDMDQWYHNPDELHRIIVWVEDGNESTWGTNEEYEGDEMAYRFGIGRAVRRLYARCLEIRDGLDRKSGLGVVACGHLGLARGSFGEEALESPCGTNVEFAPSLLQEGLVRGLLDQRVLEGVARRRHSPALVKDRGIGQLPESVA